MSRAGTTPTFILFLLACDGRSSLVSFERSEMGKCKNSINRAVKEMLKL